MMHLQRQPQEQHAQVEDDEENVVNRSSPVVFFPGIHDNQASHETRHTRVSNCLVQLQSLHLGRPEGMKLRHQDASWLHTSSTKQPPSSHCMSDPHAHMVAARSKMEIAEVMQQRKQFSADAMFVIIRIPIADCCLCIPRI